MRSKKYGVPRHRDLVKFRGTKLAILRLFIQHIVYASNQNTPIYKITIFSGYANHKIHCLKKFNSLGTLAQIFTDLTQHIV